MTSAQVVETSVTHQQQFFSELLSPGRSQHTNRLVNVDMSLPFPFGELLGSFSTTLGPRANITIDPDLSRD